MNRHLIAKATMVTIVGLVATSVAPTPSHAHSGNQTYLYIDVTDKTLGGRLEIPVPDLRLVLGLELEGSDDAIAAELQASEPKIDEYLAEHVTIGADGPTWPMEFAAPTLFYADAAEQNANYVVVEFVVGVPVAEVPRRLTIRFDPFLDEIEGRDGLLLIGNDYEGGVIENGHNALVSFGDSTRTQTIDLGDASRLKTFRASITLGVNHIRTGPDHIMFILVLLLPSVLVFASGWRPAKSFRSALWRVSKTVTMFTIAHTITFSLAGLDILPLPPSRFVESVIALSIAAAALHNLRPIALNKEWLIAFVFGLFHGMGFAAVVEGLDVAQSTKLIALAGRNVGIELGQTGVVLLVFPALFILRRTRYFRPFFVVASLALAFISLGWSLERVFEVDLSVTTFVQPLVDWPQAFGYVLVFTIIAAALYQYDKRRGLLLSARDDAEDRPVSDSDDALVTAS